MVHNKSNSKILLLVFFVVLAFGSCRKEDSSPEYKYYVSSEIVMTYNQAYINSLISTAAGTLPEIVTLAPLVKSDVNVYRVVYTTNIDGVSTDVSGLVCVPVTAGDYPVLSFQNGTNTVNAYSPSEFPLSYSYQFIEIIASMGYVVAIPDYPGFGESSQIPHPYLVKEPTVQSLVDMLFAVNEFGVNNLKGITIKDEYYLLGYSQGGWATLALHKALEQEYSSDFNLKGSACGAGPYNIFLLMQEMTSASTYPMPVYLGYILNSYKAYNQFTNPVSDIFNEPYASKVNNLYNGLLTSEEINSQLTTSIPDLIVPQFLSDFTTSANYASVRNALNSNSISGWQTNIPLMLIHGENDTSVNPVSTENMYSAMIVEGTSAEICKKVIIPGADHSDGVAPFIIQGIVFLNNLKGTDLK